MSQKPQQIKTSNFPSIQNIQNNLNFSPSQTKKKSPNYKKKKSKLFTKELKQKELTLLDFYNENIDPKQYYKQKKKKELLERTNNINNNITIGPITINNNSDNPDNSNNLDISDILINDCYSLDFSDSENEKINKEKEKEREEIIKKIEKRTDDVSLIEFDIYDYSKLIDINDDIDVLYLETKNKKDIFIYDDKISTNSSDKHCPIIKLIKKATIKNDKNYEKRQNNFKRIKNIPKNGKSISKNKIKERSRSSSINR